MSGRDRPRWRLLRRFLLSYIVVFFVPVLLSTRVYFTSVRNAREASDEHLVREIEKASVLIDDRLAEIRAMNALMAESRVITALYDLEADLSGSPHAYKVYAANEYLQSQYLYNGIVDEYLIFYRHNDIVLSRTGTSVNRTYYQGDSFSPVSRSYEEWIHFLFDRYHSGTVVPGDRVLLDSSPIRGILYLQSIPMGFPHRAKAVICNIIPGKSLSAVLESVHAGDDGFVAVYAADGALVASVGIPLQEGTVGDEPTGHRVVATPEHDLALTWLVSETSGWRYVVGVPLDTLRAGWIQERNNVLAILVLSLLCAGVFAVSFAHRSVGPISHALTLVSDVFADRAGERDDLAYLEESVKKVVSEHRVLSNSNESLRARIRRQHALLHDSFVERLTLEGFSCERDAVEFQNQLGLDLSGCDYVAGVVHIWGFSADMDAEQIVEMDDAKGLVRDVLTESFGGRILFHATSHGFAVVILLPKDEADCDEAWIDETIARAGLRLLSDHGTRIFSATGTRERRLERVTRSWSEAERLFDLACPSGTRFHVSAGVGPEATPTPPLSLRLEEKLINAVRSGNVETTSVVLDEILGHALSSQRSTPLSVQLLTQELLTAAMRLLGPDTDAEQIRSLIVRLDERSDMVWRLTSVVEVILEAARRNATRAEARDAETKRRLIEFIEENFHDPNLQISDLRRVTSYSVNYLYRFFRSQVGTTFASYLEERRIAHAADLLADETSLIQDVASACGYNSCHAFRRAFKRVKGVIPTEYRDELRRRDGTATAG